MAEVSEKVAQLSDTEILRSFREALVALYPILQRLDCISDDTQPYDPFDKVAARLWEVLVLESLQWKHGLEAIPRLPPYGFTGVSVGPDGYIEVRGLSAEPFRFERFVGDRDFGPDPFNCVQGVKASGVPVAVCFGDELSFSWVRGLK